MVVKAVIRIRRASSSGFNERVQSAVASLRQLGDKSEQDDGVGDDNSDEEEEPHHRRQAQGASGDGEGNQGTHNSQGHAEHHDKGIPQRTHGGDHDQIDHGDADDHCQIDAGELLLNVAGQTHLLYGDAGR